jgi:hypothetical protein
MAFSIDIKGDIAKEIGAEFIRLKDDIEESLARNMGEAARVVNGKLPVNKKTGFGGFLKSGFQFQQVNDFEYIFENPIKYAPFVDFGTGSQVQIPAGMEAFAKEFYRTGEGRMKAQPHMTYVVKEYYEKFLNELKQLK